MLKSNPTSMKGELFYSLCSVQDQFLEVFFLQPENVIMSLTKEVGTGLEQKQRPLCACQIGFVSHSTTEMEFKNVITLNEAWQ